MRFVSPVPFFALVAVLCSCEKPTITSYDSDGDGYENKIDCAPMDPEIHPGALDRCGDRVDNDCDREVDEECRIEVRNRAGTTCVTACDGRALCWTGDACGVNEADDALCWGPYIYSEVYRPTRRMDESFTWVQYPCGVTAFGTVDCYGPKTFEEAVAPALPRTTLDPLVHMPRAGVGGELPEPS